MLGQRRRRWPNIKPALGQCFVFVESEAVIFLQSRIVYFSVFLCIDLSLHVSITLHNGVQLVWMTHADLAREAVISLIR